MLRSFVSMNDMYNCTYVKYVTLFVRFPVYVCHNVEVELFIRTGEMTIMTYNIKVITQIHRAFLTCTGVFSAQSTEIFSIARRLGPSLAARSVINVSKE